MVAVEPVGRRNVRGSTASTVGCGIVLGILALAVLIPVLIVIWRWAL
jgi:hypothetical protein